MIKIDDDGDAIIDWDEGDEKCTVWRNWRDCSVKVDLWNRIRIFGVEVSGVHAKRLKAAVNTAKPRNSVQFHAVVGRHLIPQTTGEVSERILRACYD